MPKPVKLTAAPARCRLDLVCDRTTEKLGLRGIRLATGATAPTLCCQACAEAASAQAGGQQ